MNEGRGIGILSPQYVVGELQVDVNSLENKSQILNQYGLPDIQELWGWKHFRKCQSSVLDMACQSAAKTIEASRLPAAEIDAVIFCSGGRLGYSEQNDFLGELADRLKIQPAFFNWLTGAGCASLFSAMQMARSLIAANIVKNILIIAADCALDKDRFQRYGVLSDGACSLIVTSGQYVGFEILGSRILTCPVSLKHGDQNYQNKFALIYKAFEELSRDTAFTFSEVNVILGTNIFKPVQDTELSVMPAETAEIFQDNTARYGHCFSSDPIINLVDFYADKPSGQYEYALLTSTAIGHFGVILLKRT